MQLVDVEYLFGGERLIFYYLADKRVDFRELVSRWLLSLKPGSKCGRLVCGMKQNFSPIMVTAVNQPAVTRTWMKCLRLDEDG
ncbi:MAG: PSP1 domain-containing protein [Planctomycetaceae bacterium]